MIDKIQATSSLMSSGVNALSGSGKTENTLMGTALAAAGTAVAGPTFGAVLGDMAQDVIGSLKKSEGAAFAGIQGTASTREVVDSVMQAQQSLNTAVAIRDKVVTAYLEITRMQI